MSEDEDRKLIKAYKRNMVIVAVLAVFLAGSILFSAFQTVYIYKLNTGKTGTMDYVPSQTTEGEATPMNHVDTANLPDPWFSLEEAASVTDPNKQKLSVTEIVDKVSPATFSLYTKGDINGAERTLVSGSGFVITKDGYAVTNAHVIEKASQNPDYKLYASIPGNTEQIPCDIIGLDTQTDCAVIKLKGDREYACVTLGSSTNLRTGELVVAIGNALGTLDGTVTVGVVSAVQRSLNHDGYSLPVIQTDAAINEGNSGGPLINSFGEVVGITNAKMVVNDAEGLGFAITIDKVKDVIESLINYGVVVNRCYLGVTLGQVAEGSYYNAVPGVYVVEYVEDGPADKAGFRIGDRVISVNGVAIGKTDDIIEMRDRNNVGDTLHFVVDRNGEEIGIDLVIGDSADYQDNKTITDDSGRSGSKRGGSDDETDETEETNIFGGKK